MKQKLLAAGFVFFGTILAGCGGYSGYGGSYVRYGPPPPRYGVIGRAPGPGYVWTDGYWNWSGRPLFVEGWPLAASATPWSPLGSAFLEAGWPRLALPRRPLAVGSPIAGLPGSIRSKGGVAAIVVADADGFADFVQEDFTVADLAGAGGGR